MDSVRGPVYFSGKVQQVGFRYTACYLAKDFSLCGWVDNLPDGRVEMEVQGPISSLRKFIIRLKAQPHIHIEHMDIAQIPCLPASRRFLPRRPAHPGQPF
ncbi:MAG: acylphosphatase [Clostridia bacterium]|nr:acylphosphatase [Clostridia bacterium]